MSVTEITLTIVPIYELVFFSLTWEQFQEGISSCQPTRTNSREITEGEQEQHSNNTKNPEADSRGYRSLPFSWLVYPGIWVNALYRLFHVTDVAPRTREIKTPPFLNANYPWLKNTLSIIICQHSHVPASPICMLAFSECCCCSGLSSCLTSNLDGGCTPGTNPGYCCGWRVRAICLHRDALLWCYTMSTTPRTPLLWWLKAWIWGKTRTCCRMAQSTQRIDMFPQDTEQLAEASSVLLSLPTAFHSNLVSSANVTNCICLFLLLSLRQLQIIL